MIGFGPYLNFLPQEHKSDFREQVETIKTQFNATKAELNATKFELNETKIELNKINEQLKITQEKLNSIELNFDFMGQINEELGSMFDNPEFSDFSFCVNEKTYFAHKAVLASHSVVFAAMFRSNMKESHTNNAVIDDCDSDVFQVFLNYLYTGDITKVKPMCEQLLPLSDKYQITPLKTICENYVEIVNENAINVLLMAEKFSADKLKDRAVEHIVKNLQELKSKFTPDFFKDHPYLAYSIFESIKI